MSVTIYLAGCLTGSVLLILTQHISRFIRKRLRKESAIYGLDHGIFNVEIPPRSMWMNMGYWKGKDVDFPTACRALLEEVLKSAGVLVQDDIPVSTPGPMPMKLIDLGFGCGDQTIYLTQGLLRQNTSPSVINESSPRQDISTSALFSDYTGITLDPAQFRFTHQRLMSLGILNSERHPGNSESREKARDVQIFCADAAKPAEWSHELKGAVKPDHLILRDESRAIVPLEPAPTWVLALDTLYHFSPSRQAIFNHAFRNLHASIMAFDLLVADNTTLTDRLLLRLIARLTGACFSNFLTVVEYKAQLAAAGYAIAQVEMRDVSEYVFGPLADFLDKRDRELRMIFRQGGIGAFRGFSLVLRWWARRGVVRGFIVVARR